MKAFDELASNLLSFVEQAEDGDLPLWQRLRIWKWMETTLPDAEERRNWLALSNAREHLPLWTVRPNDSDYSSAPVTILNCARDWLQRNTDNEAIDALLTQYDVIDDVEDELYDTHGIGVFVFHMCVSVLGRLLDCDDDEYNDHDWYDKCDTGMRTEISDEAVQEMGATNTMDVHFYGAMMSSGGAVWFSGSDSDKRRQYWDQWIRGLLRRSATSTVESLRVDFSN